jgi:hypothetical protein
MPKTKEYYPLYVCKKMVKEIPSYHMSVQDMKDLTENLISKDQKEAIVKNILSSLDKKYIAAFRSYSDISDDNKQILDFMATVSAWSENKQVFKFDNDFLMELAATDDFHLSKNIWDYLPCSTMYFDLEDCSYITDNFGIKGIFVKVVKDTKQDSWELHIFRMVDDCKFRPSTLYLKNEDGDFSWDLIDAETKLHFDMLKLMCGDEYLDERMKQAKPIILVFQMLCYLSSIEPDIAESDTTKATYRPHKANAPVKNKFSEIQQHEVGVRFGTAFRKFKKSATYTGTGSEHKTSSSKRPHYRRAHWSYYWYNIKDNNGNTIYNVYGVPEKVKRPKWVEATFVNENYGEADVVIHKVS